MWRRAATFWRWAGRACVVLAGLFAILWPASYAVTRPDAKGNAAAAFEMWLRVNTHRTALFVTPDRLAVAYAHHERPFGMNGDTMPADAGAQRVMWPPHDEMLATHLGFGAYFSTRTTVYDRTMALIQVNGKLKYAHHQSIVANGDVAASVPLWFMPPFMLAVAYACARSRRWSLARASARTHLCAGCGYDLRATPDRCPECGITPVMA